MSASVSLNPMRKCSAHRLTAFGLPCSGFGTGPAPKVRRRRGTMLVVWSSVPVLLSGVAVFWEYGS